MKPTAIGRGSQHSSMRTLVINFPHIPLLRRLSWRFSRQSIRNCHLSSLTALRTMNSKMLKCFSCFSSAEESSLYATEGKCRVKVLLCCALAFVIISFPFLVDRENRVVSFFWYCWFHWLVRQSQFNFKGKSKEQSKVLHWTATRGLGSWRKSKLTLIFCNSVLLFLAGFA